jgi:hypothetical protein
MGVDATQLDKASPEALQALRIASEVYPDARFAAYQNMALDSALCGHMQFLAIGPTNTYKEPPPHYPDGVGAGTLMGWRYLFVGWVDLETGEVKHDSPKPRS